MLSLTNSLIPTKYEVELTIEPSRANFRGFLRVFLTKNRNSGVSDEVTGFSLHGQDLVVLSAKIGDKSLTVTCNRQVGVIQFQAETGPLAISQQLQKEVVVDIEYVGKIHSIKTFQDFTRGIFKTNFMDPDTGNSDNYVVATHGQPGFAKMMVPCIDEINHKAQFQLTINTLERFVVVSNTPMVSQSAPGPQSTLKKVRFGTTPLMTPSLFGFTLGDLKSIEAEVPLPQGHLPVRFFAVQDVELATFGLDTVCEFLPALQEMFQVEYPLKKLDFALVPFLSDMAMENFGLVTVQQGHLLLEPSMLADATTRGQVQQLVVHELVHQWMGNLISFDSWEHLWFNEAFATWCACEILSVTTGKDHWSSQEYLQQLNSSLKQDASIECQSIVQSSHKSTIVQTSDAVDPHSYTKGIAIIRSLQRCIGPKKFKEALQSFMGQVEFHKRGIKPSEIWNYFGQLLKSANIANFMFSWTQTASFPVLHVSVKDGATVLKQHRSQGGANDDTEDVPYHLPLFARLPDGSMDEKHVLMTDRSLTLTYPTIVFNSDVQGYYRVSYESAKCYDRLCDGLVSGALSELDLYGVFRDLEGFLGDETYQKREHIDGLLQVLRTIASRVELEMFPKYYHGLSLGLTILQQFEVSILRFGSDKNDFGFVASIIGPLFRQFKWPNDFQNGKYEFHQLHTMSQVLSAGKSLPEVQSVCAKYYKIVLQGPNNALPSEILDSIFTVSSFQNSSLKHWKKHYELAKSSQGISNHISGLSAGEIQTIALETVGFSTSLELVRKVLNYVLTNFDVDGSERALFGLSYNAKYSYGAEQIRDVVWEWFTLHFDKWAQKSVLDDSRNTQRLRNTLMAISVVVFEMWQDAPEKIDIFTIAKQAKFGKGLRIAEIWASVKRSNVPKMIIYQGLLGF
ncbi:LADA_0E09384g1_1 [Lachancea dasiensis]|uniref:Aminopeptidase n=1 Tax=Lachancea dasiensis TaxID=1072105 RepID=A0A1G4JDR7_9SACH|nr:LADA_0E09384g1_1 [Lachancea dasiensis]